MLWVREYSNTNPERELAGLVWPRGLVGGTQVLVSLVGCAKACGFHSEKMGVFGGFGAPSDLV